MIKAYSQRLLLPYSGQAQIAESERARAVTMDGETWEIHFLNAANGFARVAKILHSELGNFANGTVRNAAEVDERIVELTAFLVTASLPFPAADKLEYWLMDPKDDTPLALIFSCSSGEEMARFPVRPEWTALPAAVMPIVPTEEEKQRSDSPVNYRFERLVAERAGSNPHARWFQRGPGESDEFPPLMVRENWSDAAHDDICQRYLTRQSTRLLMLHDLDNEDRRRLERAAKPYAMEVLRFYGLYPEFADDELMRTILVEARLRASMGENDNRLERRDGVLYL